MAYVFLSPHFDDAVGSCGGTIARLAARSEDVGILTIFGGEGEEPFSPFAQTLHRLWGIAGAPVSGRRREDAEASAVLGCRSEWLDYAEAIYRKDADGAALYARNEDLFGEIRTADEGLAETIGEELKRRLAPGGVVFAPAGFGNHVDHRIARAAGEHLRRAGLRLCFYREFFYEDEGAAAYSGLRRIEAPFGARAFEAKCAAFARYCSQTPVLFGSEARMREAFRATDRRDSGAGFAEAFWMDPAETMEGFP